MKYLRLYIYKMPILYSERDQLIFDIAIQSLLWDKRQREREGERESN